MKLSLVSIHIEKSSRAVSLGSAMLASTLKQHFKDQVQVGLLDFYLNDPPELCVERILQQQPNWVGLSLAVWNRPLALEIADRLKKLRPDLVILIGGPEATADQEKLTRHPALDLVLPGEGEQLLTEILTGFFDGRSIDELSSDIRPLAIDDLALLPSPWLDGTLSPQQSGAVWQLSRGCPFKCDFCFESLGAKGIRRFPLERLQAELKLFAAAGVNQVFVLDPTFNFHPEMAKQMLRMMREIAPGIHFHMEVRGEFIDEEMAALFAELRCSLQIGLQSADPEVLSKLNRSFDPVDFEQKMLLLHQAEVSYGFDLIFGLPGDTLQGFLNSLDFALALAPNHLDIFPLSVLPGTRLAETAPDLGLVYAPDPPYQIISAPGFSESDLLQAAKIAEVCALFYSKGAAVPWFALLLENLQWRPAEFFLRLSVWCQEEEPNLQDIPRLQQDFLYHLFEELGQPDSGRIAADIAIYFACYAALTDPTRGCDDKEWTDSFLNPLALFTEFRTEPTELLANLQRGISDFEELAFFLEEEPTEAVIYLHEGEVDLMTLTEEQSSLLKNLPDRREEASLEGDLADFLEEAMARGIVRRAVR